MNTKKPTATPTLPLKVAPYGQQHLAAVSSETKMCTPDLAKHLRITCHFERQRPINDDNLRRLGAEAARGWFVHGTAITICVLPDGSGRIVNGNHTLEMIAATGISIPLVFIYIEVASLEEAGRVYANFDIQRTRSWTERMAATGDGVGIPHANKVLSAMTFILNDFKGERPTPESRSARVRFELMKEYQRAAEIVASALQGTPAISQRRILVAPVMAMALVTAKYQPSAAYEFWHALATDDGLKVGDPRKALLRYFSNNPMRGTSARMVTIGAVALAWNAFFTNKPLEFCKPNAVVSFKILGTPWHGVPPAPATPSAPVKPIMQTGMTATHGGMQPVTMFAP